MTGVNAQSEEYESFFILGQDALFTNLRLGRTTIPEGLYAYDLRDECDGNINELKEFVLVNHWGTVLVKEPIEGANKGVQISDFHNIKLNSFDNEQIKEYALKSGIDNAEEFIAELSEKAYGVSDNPFYLKMAASVYKTEHHLPPIHDFIKQALHKRFIDSSRKISVECCNNIMDNEYTLNLSFKKLAFVMQVMGMPCIINENYTRLIDYDLRKLQQYSGIINLQEDTYDRYFEHDLLREYYVSELIYNMSLETLINIISFEIQGKRIVKRFWYEVVYNTLYKRKSHDLIDWLIENDFEFYNKAETEKLPAISDINIAIKLIEYCISHKINIRSIKYDFEAIIEKYDNDDTWDFVFNKIKEKNENISLLTLLHVIKCAPQDRLDISVLDILFTILKRMYI